VTAKKAAGEWQPAFLATLAQTANVRQACAAADVSRKTAYQHRERSATFRADWDIALEEACDRLEAIAWERAATVSDTLCIFLLKAHRPAKYRDTYRHEVTDGHGGPLKLVVEVVRDRAD
jgi:hypothetical protein